MTDKSVFSDDEWNALRNAPALVTMAAFAAGEHGPISMMKEATASARAIARPGDRGAANALIAELAQHAESKEVRHDVKGHQRATIEATIDEALAALQPAAAALEKLPADEAVQIGAWLVDIAKAEAEAAKTVNPVEQATIDKIAALFNVTST
jgi:hypothetical protein